MMASTRDDRPADRIRVLLLVPELGIGGAETHVMHLLERLDKTAFSASLCCLKAGAADWEERARRSAESYTVLGFRMRTLPVSTFRLARLLKRERIDVLHCHLSLADSIGRIAGAIARVPVIMTTEHGKHLWKSKPHLMLERLLARWTDLRICVSRDIIDIRMRSEGTPAERIAYIPNGVDPAGVRRATRGKAAVMAEFGWKAESPLLLAVGRLVPAKHYETLAETVSLLRERIPGIRCLIAGEGRSEPDVRAAIERFDVRDCIVLTGSRHDVPDLLAAADVFVLTSIREGLPVSLLEAMAAEKAIVGTNVGGVPDAITNGVSGLLVPPRDPTAAADAISRVLCDPKLRQSLGSAAARVVEERFSIDSMVRQVSEKYRTLYALKKGRGD